MSKPLNWSDLELQKRLVIFFGKTLLGKILQACRVQQQKLLQMEVWNMINLQGNSLSPEVVQLRRWSQTLITFVQKKPYKLLINVWMPRRKEKSDTFTCYNSCPSYTTTSCQLDPSLQLQQALSCQKKLQFSSYSLLKCKGLVNLKY